MSTPDQPTAETSAVPPAPSNPFVPVYREPWVNPHRRRHVAGIGVAALLIALGAGIGIGWAVGDHGPRPGHGPRGVYIVPAGGFGPGMHGPDGRIGVLPGRGYAPNGGEVGVPPGAPPSASRTG
jgi:hypothetical protein